MSCTWVETHATDLVRGEAELSPEVSEHLGACADCRAVADGAASLRADLDRWTAPDPPAGLVDRALAGLALAHIRPDGDGTDGAAAGEVIPFPTPAPRRRRRTTVEVLTDAHLRNPSPSDEAPSRRQLLWRLTVQAAAALVLFGVCTTFAAVFYPAVAQALEDRDVHECQARLQRLGQAAMLYHREHPEAQDLRGPALRQALVQGGYADPLDFTCPGKQGKELQERSYWAFLPGGKTAVSGDTPIYWDKFKNHPTGINIVYADGRVETLKPEALHRWARFGRP